MLGVVGPRRGLAIMAMCFLCGCVLRGLGRLWALVGWICVFGLDWGDVRGKSFEYSLTHALLGLHSDAGWEILLGRFVWDAYGPFIQYKNRIRPRKYWASTWAEFGPAMGQPGPMMIMLWILSSEVRCPNQNTQN